eukprot:3053487-Rhodomonas_salina.4
MGVRNLNSTTPPLTSWSNHRSIPSFSTDQTIASCASVPTKAYQHSTVQYYRRQRPCVGHSAVRPTAYCVAQYRTARRLVSELTLKMRPTVFAISALSAGTSSSLRGRTAEGEGGGRLWRRRGGG